MSEPYYSQPAQCLRLCDRFFICNCGDCEENEKQWQRLKSNSPAHTFWWTSANKVGLHLFCSPATAFIHMEESSLPSDVITSHLCMSVSWINKTSAYALHFGLAWVDSRLILLIARCEKRWQYCSSNLRKFFMPWCHCRSSAHANSNGVGILAREPVPLLLLPSNLLRFLSRSWAENPIGQGMHYSLLNEEMGLGSASYAASVSTPCLTENTPCPISWKVNYNEQNITLCFHD